MNWVGKKVLITGAGGFIGSHLTERLVALGANVQAFVHYNSNGSWGLLDESQYKKDIEFVPGDIVDKDGVYQAMDGNELIFHLAALISIPYSYNSPMSYIRTNMEGTYNVLQSARNIGPEKVVITSTSEVYGSAQYVPIDETHPLQSQSPYAASKIAADKLAEAFYFSYGLPVTTIRPFNTYGPRQSARAVIPTIITQALTGSSVKLGHLEPTRDFNYVDDTVNGFIKMAESAESIGTVINIGSGKEISIGDLANVIIKIVGIDDLMVKCDDARLRPDSSEVDRLCAQNTKARDILGWSPEYSLDEGLRKTIDFISENISNYRIGSYAI